MSEEKGLAPIVIILPVVVALIFVVVGLLAWQQYKITSQPAEQVACTQEAMQCADGSYVSRTGPNCEFAACPVQSGQTYTNNQYGFSLQLPDSWAGYSITEAIWDSWYIDNISGTPPSGPMVSLRNPKWTTQQHWQDITIMVFTKGQWNLVTQEKVAISAAPVGPQKVGENQNYIFALPPRWVGFTDDLGGEEAIKISQTFKAF